jgi:hypothetical protein
VGGAAVAYGFDFMMSKILVMEEVPEMSNSAGAREKPRQAASLSQPPHPNTSLRLKPVLNIIISLTRATLSIRSDSQKELPQGFKGTTGGPRAL